MNFNVIALSKSHYLCNMLTKEKLLATIKELPNEFSVEELFERVILLHKVEIGLEQSKKGEGITTAEARKKLQKWLLK